MTSYADLGPLKLAYERSGPVGGETIVLIRGLGTQMTEWPHNFIDALGAAGLNVVTFDNRDVGLSSKLDQPYELKDMAADVVGLLDHLDVATAHVFGISLGGMVAQLVAFHYPDRVATLYSVMSHSGNPDLELISAEAGKHLLEEASDREGVIRLNCANRLRFGSPGYPETQAERFSAAEAAYDRCFCPEGVARQMAAVRADGSRVDRLSQITVPTLVIHGADDPLVALAGGRDTARLIPGSQLEVVAGMGHNIPAALAPEIAGLVVNFIRR